MSLMRQRCANVPGIMRQRCANDPFSTKYAMDEVTYAPTLRQRAQNHAPTMCQGPHCPKMSSWIRGFSRQLARQWCANVPLPWSLLSLKVFWHGWTVVSNRPALEINHSHVPWPIENTIILTWDSPNGQQNANIVCRRCQQVSYEIFIGLFVLHSRKQVLESDGYPPVSLQQFASFSIQQLCGLLFPS